MAWSNTSARTKFSVEKSHSLSFSVRIEDRLHVNVLNEADECWLTVRPGSFKLGQDDNDLDSAASAPSGTGVGFKADGVFYEMTPTPEQEGSMDSETLEIMVRESRLFQFAIQASALDLDPELDWWYDITYVKDNYSMSVAAGEFEVTANPTNRGAALDPFGGVGDVFQLVSTINGRNLLNVTATLPMPQTGPPGTGTYYTTSALSEAVAGTATIQLATIVVAAGRTLQVGDILFSSVTKGVLSVVTNINWTATPITVEATTLQLYGKDGLNALLDQTFRDTSVGQPFAAFAASPPHPTNTWQINKTDAPIPAGVGLQYHAGDYVMHHAGVTDDAVSTVLVISLVTAVGATTLTVRPVVVFPLFLNSYQLQLMLESYSLIGHTHAIADTTGLGGALDGKVPVARKVNGKALNADVTLTPDDFTSDGVNFKRYSAAEKTKLGALPEAAALTTSLEGKPDSADIDTIKVMTLAAYTALPVKDPRTQYLISG